MKKFVATITMITMCTSILILPATPAKAAELTHEQKFMVVDWAYKNAYGTRYSNMNCLAYIYHAYHYLGIDLSPTGSYSSAKAAAEAAMARGEFYRDSIPPYGSIVYYSDSKGKYGHAALACDAGYVISANLKREGYGNQRVFRHELNAQWLRDMYGGRLQYEGYFYPVECTPVNESTENEKFIINRSIQKTLSNNAIRVNARCFTEYKQMTKAGLEVKNASGNKWTVEEKLSIKDKYVDIWYLIPSHLHLPRKNSTYTYRFFVEVDGSRIYGPYSTFTY